MTPGKSGLIITPKLVIDREVARERFFQTVDEVRGRAKNADPEEMAGEIDEGIRAVRKAKTRTKRR